MDPLLQYSIEKIQFQDQEMFMVISLNKKTQKFSNRKIYKGKKIINFRIFPNDHTWSLDDFIFKFLILSRGLISWKKL